MVEELGTPPEQRTVDDRHLSVLSILHFVGAGLAFLGLGFVGLHYAMFSSVFNNPDLWKGAAQPPPADFFGVFKWIYVVLAAWYVTSLVLNLFTGIYLRRKVHRSVLLRRRRHELPAVPPRHDPRDLHDHRAGARLRPQGVREPGVRRRAPAVASGSPVILLPGWRSAEHASRPR